MSQKYKLAPKALDPPIEETQIITRVPKFELSLGLCFKI